MEELTKKRKRRHCPNELPTMPPFSGTLEWTSTGSKPRKHDPLLLLPTSQESSLASLYNSIHNQTGQRGICWTIHPGAPEGCRGFGWRDKQVQSTDPAYHACLKSRFYRSPSQGRLHLLQGSIFACRAGAMEGKKKAAVIVAAEELVHQVMGAWDSSHDPFHALRVRDLALSLACEEGLRLSSFLTVELAALLHDIEDHKYAASDERVTVESFLKLHNVESNTAASVLKIVTTMGFKEELEGSGNEPISPEFAVLQDADRLDAIGAIGIARAFTYGGSKNRKMHDPAQAPRTSLTKSDYTSAHAHPTTINHFAEKLLKLKDLMESQAGKKKAMQRHEFMFSFLQKFHGEWEGKQ